MSWILAVLGFLLGLVIAFLNDLPVLEFAAFCAVVGFLVGHAARKNKTALPAQATAGLPQPVSSTALADRVLRLEREVAMLRNEILRMGGQPVQDLPPHEAAPASHASADAADAADDPLYGLPRDTLDNDPQTASDSQQSEPFSIPASVPAAVPASISASVSTSVSASIPASAPAEFHALNAAEAVELDHTADAPRQPAGPREPGLIERAIKAGRDWLFGGNTVVRVGIIVLFFGIAFLLKYAADNDMFPVEFRLAGVALAATALLVIGWRVRVSRPAYGLALQGGGVGILYLTVFAATKLYQMLPTGASLPLMIAICVLSALLAVRQNAASLAFMGSAGGFLAPVLLSTGGGSHIALFSYYALLNAGIFAIAWFKAWRPLNLLGFVFTFGIGAAWGAKAYVPALFSTTEPFLLLFFLMYVGIALLYAVRREIALKHYVDGTLVFGTPLVAIALQAAMVRDFEFGLAWSAVALAAFYLGIATWLRGRRGRLGLLFESMLALAVIFATLAVPLAFTGPTTSAVWAVEGAAIVWISVRQRRLLALAFGLLLQLAAGVTFFQDVTSEDVTGLPILNGPYIGSLLIALAGIFSGWRLHGRRESREWHPWLTAVGLGPAVWGLLWWTFGGLIEIKRHYEMYASFLPHYLIPTPSVLYAGRFILLADAAVLFVLLSAWLSHFARRVLDWPLAGRPGFALVPSLTVIVLLAWVGLDAASLSSITALPVAIVLAYLLLYRQQRYAGDRLLKPLHTLMCWTLSALLALEGSWQLYEWVPGGTWSWSAWAYGLGVMLLLLAGPGARLRWPVMRFMRAYLVWGAAPLALLLWVWSICSVFSDGDAAPLFYLPILNPLDVAQLLAVLAVAVWLKRLTAMGVKWQHAMFDYAALATVFLWFNAMLLRTLHHHFGVDYDLEAVVSSFTNQQVFLLGWSAFALAGLWLARRDSMLRLFAIASTPVVAVMWLWTFAANFTQDGGSYSRLPLLNPLDLVQVAIFGLAALWLSRLRRIGAPVARYRVGLRVLASITAFVWLNTMLLRTLHHWAGVPYTLDDLSQSTLVQASVSVFWTVCALATMILATRRRARLLWFIGGGLLAITVIKLFLFDLSFLNGIARIVSFIGIGVMLLLIGYFSPLPPKAKLKEAAA